MDVVVTHNLTKAYRLGGVEVLAVNDANLRIHKGEFAAIVGPPGSGKTTLYHLLGGLETPTSGTVEINGMELLSLPDTQQGIFRRQTIGYTSQDVHLTPSLTAEENILMPTLLDAQAADAESLMELSGFLGLEDLLKRLPSELSDEQKQRVALARALIRRPSILLADEPAGHLDKPAAYEILRLLLEANQRGQTVALFTQCPNYAGVCQRILVIEDGGTLIEVRKGGGACSPSQLH